MPVRLGIPPKRTRYARYSHQSDLFNRGWIVVVWDETEGMHKVASFGPARVHGIATKGWAQQF